MAKAGIARTNVLILRSYREANRVHRPYSSHQAVLEHDHDYYHHNYQADKSSRNSIKEGKIDDSSCWIPHPRTGIYVPKGQEWMMDDVPENAASFNQTYWLRNVDGVDKPDPDLSSDNYLSTNLY